MKRLMLALAALALATGASQIAAADEPTATQPSAAQPSAAQPSASQPAASPAANAPAMGNSQAAQAPSQEWTSLKGTVMAVDPAAKIVQLKDDSTGNLIQVPLDKQVMIQKDGKRVKLSQIKAGDTILLAKRNATPQEQEKPKSY